MGSRPGKTAAGGGAWGEEAEAEGAETTTQGRTGLFDLTLLPDTLDFFLPFLGCFPRTIFLTFCLASLEQEGGVPGQVSGDENDNEDKLLQH